MSKREWTEEQKVNALNLYREYGPRAAADYAGTQISTVSRWAQAEGVKWENRPKAQHGTRSGYQSGCRCDECRTALRDYARDRRRENGGTQGKRVDIPEERHGKNSTYMNYGCRCDPCKAVNSAAQKAERERRQARKAEQPASA